MPPRDHRRDRERVASAARPFWPTTPLRRRSAPASPPIPARETRPARSKRPGSPNSYATVCIRSGAGVGSVSRSSRASSPTTTGAGSTASLARRQNHSRSASMRAQPSSSGPAWQCRRVVGDSAAVVLDGRYAIVRGRHEWRAGGPLGHPRHLRRRGVDRAVGPGRRAIPSRDQRRLRTRTR